MSFLLSWVEARREMAERDAQRGASVVAVRMYAEEIAMYAVLAAAERRRLAEGRLSAVPEGDGGAYVDAWAALGLVDDEMDAALVTLAEHVAAIGGD